MSEDESVFTTAARLIDALAEREKAIEGLLFERQKIDQMLAKLGHSRRGRKPRAEQKPRRGRPKNQPVKAA